MPSRPVRPIGVLSICLCLVAANAARAQRDPGNVTFRADLLRELLTARKAQIDADVVKLKMEEDEYNYLKDRIDQDIRANAAVAAPPIPPPN